jgi:Alpha/beta hydrolase family
MARTEDTVVTTISDPIACWRSGQGQPLVAVHATTADHSTWNPLLPALTAHFTVYAMDRRGRGGSGDGSTYAIEREFEDVAAVVDSIGGPVNLLGHSYGALCSLEKAHCPGDKAIADEVVQVGKHPTSFGLIQPLGSPQFLHRTQLVRRIHYSATCLRQAVPC